MLDYSFVLRCPALARALSSILKFLSSPGEPVRPFRILLLVAVITCTSIPLALHAGPTQPEYVEGEVIVTLKPSVNLDGAHKTLSKHGMGMSKHFSELSKKRGRHSGLVRQKGHSTADLMAELKQDPSVETVEPNYVRRVFGATPNDPLFGQMWGLRNTGQGVNGVTGTSG